MPRLGSIFGLYPFEPKRRLILPSEDRDIEIYVMGGKAYPDEQGVVYAVHFGGWVAPYKNATLNVPTDAKAYDQHREYAPVFLFDVAFRLVPAGKGRQRTAEVVALSFDSCETFQENELCQLGA